MIPTVCGNNSNGCKIENKDFVKNKKCRIILLSDDIFGVKRFRQW